MECKVIQFWIDNSIEEKLDTSTVKLIEEHLQDCEECKKYYLDVIEMHNSLMSLYSEHNYENKINKRVMDEIKFHSKRKFKFSWLIVASLLILLCFQFNSDIYSFAQNVTSEIFDYFSSERYIDKLKGNDFPVYDFVIEEEGYKLYIKDLYIDNGQMIGQIAIEDENNKYINDYGWDISFKEYGVKICRDDNEVDNNPWQTIEIDFELGKQNKSKIMLQENFKFNVIIEMQDKNIAFNDIDINLKALSKYETRTIKQDIVIDNDLGHIEIQELKITPSATGLKFIHEDKETSSNYFKWYLKDNKGNRYERTFRGHRENYHEFTSIYFEDDITELKVVFYEDVRRDFEEVYTGNLQQIIGHKFKYIQDKKTNIYTIDDVIIDGKNVNFEVTASNDSSIVQFPELYIKTNDHLEPSSIDLMHNKEDVIRLYKAELEVILNKDIEYIDDVGTGDYIDISIEELWKLVEKHNKSVTREMFDKRFERMYDYRITKGELEHLFEHTLDEVINNKELLKSSVELMIDYYNKKFLLFLDSNRAIEVINELNERNEMTLSLENCFITNKATYNFRIEDSKPFKLYLVKNLDFIKMNEEYELNILE